MTKRAGEMTFENVCFEIRMLPAADRVNEVREMTRTSLKLFNFVPILIPNNCPGVTRDNHRTPFTIRDDSDGCALVFVHFGRLSFIGQSAHFVYERSSF